MSHFDATLLLKGSWFALDPSGSPSLASPQRHASNACIHWQSAQAAARQRKPHPIRQRGWLFAGQGKPSNCVLPSWGEWAPPCSHDFCTWIPCCRCPIHWTLGAALLALQREGFLHEEVAWNLTRIEITFIATTRSSNRKEIGTIESYRVTAGNYRVTTESCRVTTESYRELLLRVPGHAKKKIRCDP